MNTPPATGRRPVPSTSTTQAWLAQAALQLKTFDWSRRVS